MTQRVTVPQGMTVDPTLKSPEQRSTATARRMGRVPDTVKIEI